MFRNRYILLYFLNFFSVALPALQASEYNPYINVEHYIFSIEVNDSNNEIKAAAAIKVFFLQATNVVEFDLINLNDKGKGMRVISLKENEDNVDYEHTANLLKIHLRKPAKAGDTRTYIINYGGIPADGLVFSKNKFKQRTIFADNWPNRARYWLPCVDHPSDKASVEFMITAPDHYKVISNGVLVEESSLQGNKKFTHWKEDVALPTKVMVIGLAAFAVNYVGNVDGIPVSSWVFPEHKINGFYDYAQALDILPFFIQKIGPYAYKKLANVEAITIFGGMENAAAIFYNEQSITGKRGYSEELIAHEIAHQWFGNAATESGWPHVWLSEGFATGMTNLYLENKYGADTLKKRLKADREEIIKFATTRFTPVVDSSEKENYLALLNKNSYEKGGWVLHMLRRKLGDTIFWKCMRTYYAHYTGKNASTNDLLLVMENVSGLNLKEFFHQWLYTPGHPVLLVTWKYNDNKRKLLLEITQQQENLFSFNLEFSFNRTSFIEKDKHSFFIKDRITQIELPMDVKPTQVSTDPETNLLFDGVTLEKK